MKTSMDSVAARLLAVVLVGCIGMALAPARLFAQSAYEMELMNLGRQCERYGNAVEAGRLYAQAVTLNPNCQEAHHRLGVLAAARGALDQSITHFHSALNSGPPSAQLLSDFGGALFLKGETELAEQKLQAALALDPNNADARNNLELVTAKQKEKAAAAAVLLAELRARQEAEAAQLAHRVAMARAQEETRAAAQAVASARAAAVARRIAEARLAAETQATAQALASAQAVAKAREVAKARDDAAARDAAAARPAPRSDTTATAQPKAESVRPSQAPPHNNIDNPARVAAPSVKRARENIGPGERRNAFEPPPLPAAAEEGPAKSTLVIVPQHVPQPGPQVAQVQEQPGPVVRPQPHPAALPRVVVDTQVAPTGLEQRHPLRNQASVTTPAPTTPAARPQAASPVIQNPATVASAPSRSSVGAAIAQDLADSRPVPAGRSTAPSHDPIPAPPAQAQRQAPSPTPERGRAETVPSPQRSSAGTAVAQDLGESPTPTPGSTRFTVRSATQKTASTTQTPATEAEATPPTPSQRVSLLDIYMGKSQDK